MGIYGKLSGGDIPLPKIYLTDVLSEKQLEFIASHLPEDEADPEYGPSLKQDLTYFLIFVVAAMLPNTGFPRY